MFKQRIETAIKIFREKGSCSMLQYIFRWCTGMHRQQEEIDTIFYFLNHYLDIQNLPPTKDEDLRILQKCDAEFLKLFDIICKKHGISYWLDYGTLLGAVRHKGFIPWDDDMDCGISRSDFDKFMEDVKPVFEKMNIEVEIDCGRIGLGYRHKETGIWLDIFPVDDYFTNERFEDEKVVLAKKIRKYKKKYGFGAVLSKEQYNQRKSEIIGNTEGRGHRLFYLTPEFKSIKTIIYDDKYVYPLSVLEFEGYEFPVPNNCDAYLNCIYGSRYMEFPHSGVEHHGGDAGLLKTWAKKAGVDMNKVLRELQTLCADLE